MLIAAGILSLLIWGYLLLARGNFWRMQAPPSALPDRQAARIAVIVPARNEAEVVGQAVTSLLQQAGPHSLHLFLVDDGSADGTARVAQNAANAFGQSGALTILESQPLPPGWSGKLWALHQGVEQAREFRPDYLLFTDADIVHAPENISRLAAIARAQNCDVASFMVKLHCKAMAEKLLIPAFVFFFFKLYPPAWVANPRRAEAGAAGGCLLVRPAALQAAEGIAAIRHEVIDDCALAARIK